MSIFHPAAKPEATSPPPRKGVPLARERTLYTMKTSHIENSSHVKSTIHPYVRQDLARTKYIPLYAWTQSVLGLSEKDIDESAAHIRRLRWFDDPVIREGLVDFCSTPPDATHEKARYDPFAAIVNRAFELAKRELPGIPSSYPIDDICLIRNDPKYVQCIPEHGKLGAQRSPDLLFVRGAQATKLRGSKTARVRWVDILGWSEFKASEKDVIELLNRQRKEYGLSIIDKETLKSRQPTPQVGFF
ncbi:hypothetical protein PHLCEN_2v11693 [Hermanssonia centrifuga]|uniref:Uncharacterized protein n=1 Tax=Hermanssonia centrifuga TaxID=98765 RepID=A0A2R6NJA5_9APHY|nr:hypothetical protein PHLCEN_2v11693 [Hermanssonia centrifuga]